MEGWRYRASKQGFNPVGRSGTELKPDLHQRGAEFLKPFDTSFQLGNLHKFRTHFRATVQFPKIAGVMLAKGEDATLLAAHFTGMTQMANAKLNPLGNGRLRVG